MIDKYYFLNKQLKMTDMVKQFIVIILIVTSLVISVLYISITMSTSASIAEDTIIEKNIHDVILSDLTNFQTGITSDVQVLKSNHFSNIKSNILSPSEKEHIEDLLLQFLLYKPYYTQVRFINTEGMEVIRVNHDADGIYLVEESKLQNKKDRYYFSDIMALELDGIYISELDLNIENGVIQMPKQAVLRVGTQIIVNGEVIGIVILNYEADLLVNSFMSIHQRENNNYTHYIINQEGHYLFHDNTELTWGQYNESDITIDKAYPGLLNQFDGGSHYIEYDDQIFVYSNLQDLYGLQYPDLTFITEIPKSGYLPNPIMVNGLAAIFILLAAITIFLAIRQKQLKQYISRVTNIIYHGIDQNPVVAILTDSDGNIIYVNDAFEKVTGYTFNEVYMKNPSLLKSGSLQNDIYKNMWSHILAGNSWDGEFHNRCKDGSFYWADARISAIFNKKGEVDYFLALQNDITEKKAILQKYHELAIIDPLTGAYNRNIYHVDSIEHISIEDIVKDNNMVYMIDIDFFKAINDKYGHSVGDEVLELVVYHLKQLVRDNDLIIRYGGEEFLLIVPITDVSSGLEFGNRIRLHFVNHKMQTSAGSVSLTISLGMTKATIEDHSITDIIKRADSALYDAKVGGRNRISYKQ